MRGISQWTVFTLIKKNHVSDLFLGILKNSPSFKYAVGSFTNVSMIDIVANVKFWPRQSFTAFSPSSCFIFSDLLLQSDFCGFVPDGIFRKSHRPLVYDFDGIGVREEFPPAKTIAYVNDYYEKLLLTTSPLGQIHKRQNLSRSDVGIQKDSLYYGILFSSLK